jgi:hypothetical protein
MHRFRFSLLTLFGFVAVVAIACAALARPSQLWLIVVSSSTLACLFYAILAAAYGRNARRAFWLGFAVVAWGYVALEWASAHGLPYFLPTNSLSSRLEAAIHPQATSVTAPVTSYVLASTSLVPSTAGQFYAAADGSLTAYSVPASQPVETVPAEAIPMNPYSDEEPSAPTPAEVEPPMPVVDEAAEGAVQPDQPLVVAADIEAGAPFAAFDPTVVSAPNYGAPYTVWSTVTTTTPANVVDLDSFRHIAKWLWAPLLGFAGGLLALRLHNRRERDSQTAVS